MKTEVKDEIKAEPEGPVGKSQNFESFVFLQINECTFIGESYIKRVEMFYCDLCHKYLPRSDPEQAQSVLQNHCMSTSHRNAYDKKEQEMVDLANMDVDLNTSKVQT